MRKLTLSLVAFVATLPFSFVAPVVAQEQEIQTIDNYVYRDPNSPFADFFKDFDGAEVWANDWNVLFPVPTGYMVWDLCGRDETNYLDAGDCFMPLFDGEDGSVFRILAGTIDKDGKAWANPTALTTLLMEGGIKGYPAEYFRTYAGADQKEAWPSTMKLVGEETDWHIEVTPEQWADVCDLVDGTFFPVGRTVAYEGETLISMVGPVCYAYMKPTPYLQELNVKLGVPADSELVVLGGVLEDGTPFVDYSLLEHNGLLENDILVNEEPILLWSYLDCRSSFPFTAGNGETYLIEDTRKACAPESPANADNMDAPPPFLSFIRLRS